MRRSLLAVGTSAMMLLLALYLVSACNQIYLPRPAATPTCIIRPLPTGERLFEAQDLVPPPTQMHAGESAEIRFSGGLLIAATSIQCGDDFSILRGNLETAEASTRMVTLYWDEGFLARTTCGYDCTVTFTIPAETAPGTYSLRVGSIFISNNEADFPIEILP